MAYCEDQGYRWKNVAGTSAGAITAALVAAGYTAAEIKAKLDRLLLEPATDGARGYERFKDRSLLDHIPGVGLLLNLGFEKGLYEGTVFEDWLRDLLAAKGKHTFADLKDPAEVDPRYRYRLRVIASDVSRRRLLVLPQDIVDYEEFDGEPDKLDIARAVRMSMSIPFFFEPVTLTCRPEKFPLTEAEEKRHATSGTQCTFTPPQRRCFIVDGGVLSNFPVDLLDCPPGTIPPWPTFGFRLISPSEGRPNRINGPLSLFAALFSTMLEAHDQRHIDADAEVRTIRIATENVKTTDFDLSKVESDALYLRGVQGAQKFFARWTALGGFPGYIKAFRSPKSPSPTLALQTAIAAAPLAVS